MEGLSQRSRLSWRWMILLSRFFSTFLSLGTFKSLGVFFPYFVDSFSASVAAVGFAGGASQGVGEVLMSPVAGALLKVWEPRWLIIGGGSVHALFIFLASFSSSITQLVVCFALSSLGVAFVYVSAVKPIMDYFPDDFAFVNGLSLAGGTIGMMLLPPVMEYLVSVYGWRNALGLLGAFNFNYIVCGALLRPFATSAHYTSVQNHFAEKGPASPKKRRPRQESLRDKTRNIRQTVLSFVAEQFDVRVLVEPIFIIYQLVIVLGGIVFTMWHLFLIPHGVALGYGEAPSAYLATFGGVGSLIGRLSHGILIDREILKASTLIAIAYLVFMASSLLDPLAVSSYAALATLASISGIAMGVILPVTIVIMREVTGDQHMSAYGWSYVSLGAGQIAGGVLAGWIRDVSGDYETVFVTMGVVSLIMSVIVASTRCLLPRCETKD